MPITAIEMGGDPTRNPPFFFQKNPDSLVIEGGDFPYPPKTEDVHHEIELVVALKKGGKDIAVEQALTMFMLCSRHRHDARDLQPLQRRRVVLGRWRKLLSIPRHAQPLYPCRKSPSRIAEISLKN